jgi:predicted GNAT superfamily acetyltransferase
MDPNFAGITIRPIDELSEMTEVEQLQKEIWGVEDLEVLPTLAMIPMKAVGAVLLGAFDGAELVGFSFAFPGYKDGRSFLHSDMLAVKPAYRSRRLGVQLKVAQRAAALGKGIDTITWTFDPLQALNANLNFGKLGVTSDRYVVNFYGETTSFLHSTGTDRLWVTWQLNSQHVCERLKGTAQNKPDDDLRKVLAIGKDRGPVRSTGDEPEVFLDIPTNFNQLVKDELELALFWRVASREAFTEALGRGLCVQDFYLVKNGDESFGRYLLAASQ